MEKRPELWLPGKKAEGFLVFISGKQYYYVDYKVDLLSNLYMRIPSHMANTYVITVVAQPLVSSAGSSSPPTTTNFVKPGRTLVHELWLVLLPTTTASAATLLFTLSDLEYNPDGKEFFVILVAK